ncbi:MAG: ribonuclease H-like domain-containing protein [Roseiflexaceae bacterium]|nr:ribonuclease H-like domain-containing protein [Roseiflexaceae bacterium]
MRAYLDIETTFDGAISVIGIYRADLGAIQLIGSGVRDTALYDALEGVATLVTFNGSSFDLPVIRKRLFVDLQRDFAHCDLMHVCRKRGLRGGLKAVEERLGIHRVTRGLDGRDALHLWERYKT